MTIVTASRFQEDYEKNEVAADKTYMEKRILLTAIVRSIDRSIGENYFLKLNGGSNMFIGPHAQMADGYTDYLAALEKGQKIVLACTGAGMLMGSATVKQCEPVNDWASQEAQKILSSFGERMKQKETNASILTLFAVAIENALPTASACSTAVGSECMAEVAKTIETMGKSLTLEMIATAKRIGIDPAVVSIK